MVVEVGGGLREYSLDGQPVLDGYAEDAMADGARGQPLLPWPNRLADGQYAFEAQTQQLPIDDVSRHNAIHGLTRWLNWSVGEPSATRVDMRLTLHPRPGYPFTLELTIEYSLDDSGLRVRTRARNIGPRRLPFGAGFHPYLTVGTPVVDPVKLHLPAARRLELDAERRLPTGRTLTVDGSSYDFRTPRLIGTTVLDDCFTDLQRSADGRTRVVLDDPSSARQTMLWVDENFKYIQVFSGETLGPERRRRGLAIEPMTCPPNALATGIDLILLEPAAEVALDWGLHAIR